MAVRRSQGDGFIHLTENDLLDGSWLQNPEIDWRLGIKVFGDNAAVQRLRALLKSQGVVPAVWRPLAPPQDGEVTVEQEFEVTPEMQRALAKIAFNYLAYCEGADYVLSPSFDSIRNFVRYGKPASFSVPPVLSHEGLPFTKINAGNVVLEDGSQRPVVHFVSFGFNSVHRNVAAAITLFAFMTHRVMLAEAFPGHPPLPRAHLYNVAMRRVFELGAVGRANPNSTS